MTPLQILIAVVEYEGRKDGETIRDIMNKLKIPINLENAQLTLAFNSMLGTALYMALPQSIPHRNITRS